ncbi:MAG: tungstate ABC transporter substrate-binding protein WtpA [Halobacteriota archaeon]
MKAGHRLILACFIVIALIVSAAGCITPTTTTQQTLTIFHAGSLSKPFDQLATAFQNANPGVTVQRQSAGSIDTVKKITELNQTADIVATSDYSVINQYLYPNYTNWVGKFASNKMVVMYTNTSKYASEINASNWYQILTRPDVAVGRSDPNADPNGYRTLMVWKLAQNYYNNASLYDALLAQAPQQYVRPKEVDLTALLQSGQVDYAWNYLSVAKQNNFSYVDLPDQLNLGNQSYQSYYQTVNVTASNQTVNGSYIEYGITIPTNAPNTNLAIQFIQFMYSPQGAAIMNASYQPLIVPMQTLGAVPPGLLSLTTITATAASTATSAATTTSNATKSAGAM